MIRVYKLPKNSQIKDREIYDREAEKFLISYYSINISSFFFFFLFPLLSFSSFIVIIIYIEAFDKGIIFMKMNSLHNTIAVSTSKDESIIILKYNSNYTEMIPIKVKTNEDPNHLDNPPDKVKLLNKKIICDYLCFSKDNRLLITSVGFSYKLNSIKKHIGMIKVYFYIYII